MSFFSSALVAWRETQGQDKNLTNKESVSYHGLGAVLKNAWKMQKFLLLSMRLSNHADNPAQDKKKEIQVT